MEKIKNHPVFYSLFLSAIISTFLGAVLFGQDWKSPNAFVIGLCISMVFGNFIVYPFLVTIINFITSFLKSESEEWMKSSRIFECMAMVLGFFYSGIGICFLDIKFQSNWWEVLQNQEVHTPIWTTAYPTVICLSCIGVIGYIVLSSIKIEKMPPLVIVSAIAAMYIGIIECVLWIIQIFSSSYIILGLFPANCIIIAAKTIREKILEWNEKKDNEIKSFKNKYLEFLN